MRGTRETRSYPNRDKSRERKRKATRLAREAKHNELTRAVRRLRADANIVLLREDGEVVVVPRRGLFGHARAPVFRIPDEQVVGAVEDLSELGGICTKLGVMVLAQLVGHNLAYGSDGLARALVKWAGIDLEALKKEIADERADEGGAGGGAGPGEAAGESPDVGPVDDDGPGGSESGSQPETTDGGIPSAPTKTERPEVKERP